MVRASLLDRKSVLAKARVGKGGSIVKRAEACPEALLLTNPYVLGSCRDASSYGDIGVRASSYQGEIKPYLESC